MDAAIERSTDDIGSKGRRLTQEERLTIPPLYALLGNKDKVAAKLNCSSDTVDRWLRNLSGEEWDRILEKQRAELCRRAVEIIYDCMDIVPAKLRTATLRELMGVLKITGDSAARWGGLGALKAGPGDTPGDLMQFLEAAEAKRRQTAIEEALATGSLEPLKQFATHTPTA